MGYYIIQNSLNLLNWIQHFIVFHLDL